MAEDKQVSREWISGHVANEASRLSEAELRRWDSFVVEPWIGHLSRRPGANHNDVYVVAERGRDVLYWDDIEGQFARGKRIAAKWIEGIEGVGERLTWAMQKFHPEG